MGRTIEYRKAPLVCARNIKVQTAFENTGLCCSNIYLYEVTFARRKTSEFQTLV